jgi:hypothetical protein
VYERLHGLTLWSWLAAHSEEEAIFNASMARRAAFAGGDVRRGECTKQEYDGLLVAAGFRPSDLAPSPNSWDVMTTQPVS